MNHRRQLHTRRCARSALRFGALVTTAFVLTMPGSSVANAGWSVDAAHVETTSSGPRFR